MADGGGLGLGGKGTKRTWRQEIRKNGILYILFIPTALYLILFHYIPMAGIMIAFEDYDISSGIFGSRWVGFQNFVDLFTGDSFGLVMRNTVAIAALNLALTFIFPIVFAILLSELHNKKFKRTMQIMSYLPHFVAAVVVCQLVSEFVGKSGAITQLLALFGLEKQNWLANPNVPVFWLINCFTEVWQGIGFGSIMYVASIASVSGDLHEAAAIDGAGRWKRLTKITLPCIKPIMVMMLIMSFGRFFSSGFDKVLLLYMPSTYATSDVLSTYTYRMAFGQTANYGLSTASGLFQSVLSLVLLLTANAVSRKTSEYSLF